MRVRATAMGSFQGNAIGQIELACTPSGLSLGLFGLGSYAEGYATGALTHGTRITLPYTHIQSARSQGDQLYLEFEAPRFPHDRLVLSQFSAGPGVPLLELRRRRLILQFTAISVAALACLAATILAPGSDSHALAWGALSYGLLAGCLVLALGFALDQSLLVRPPNEEATRMAFVAELSRYVPHLLVTAAAPVKKVQSRSVPPLVLPRTATGVGLMLAAIVLTALVTAERVLLQAPDRVTARRERAFSPPPAPVAASAPARSTEPDQAGIDPPIDDLPAATEDTSSHPGSESAAIERRCLCDRADSQLWKSPIPRLSSLLIERRSLQLKNYIRTHLEVGVVNNGDSPIDDLTLHVQFYEPHGKDMRPTKERPLYFEGPLRPGEAIKWSTEARGTDFEILTPDLGALGVNGEGAAPADAFFQLLDANHRPVRLHAARLLSYLGDERAREAALHLKDAMRSAETPFLRRVLMATGETRVCDIEQTDSTVGVCVYNAADHPLSEMGVQLNALSGTLDIAHPLSDPPQIRTQSKWSIPGEIPTRSGVYVRVPLESGFLAEKGSSLEVLADRLDLLE